MKNQMIMKNLAILIYSSDSGHFGESCESGHSCETSDSDDSGHSGESGASSESCYLGKSGDLIKKVFLVIFVNKLILINLVGVVVF